MSYDNVSRQSIFLVNVITDIFPGGENIYSWLTYSIFSSRQILMSARSLKTTVIKRPIASTRKEVTTVSAEKATPETEQKETVMERRLKTNNYFHLQEKQFFVVQFVYSSHSLAWRLHQQCSFFFPDVDECSLNLDDCDGEHGICENTEGSYKCSCEEGYTGPGTTNQCTGINGNTVVSTVG